MPPVAATIAGTGTARAILGAMRSMKGLTLGEFLRARRASVRPEHRGPVPVGRRRVPGLRREEVAGLVGVSVDYYTRLEQGHRVAPSEGVLNALAEVLGLDGPAREHLRDLARAESRRRDEVTVQRARPGLLRLMDSMDELPTVLFGWRLDILAASPLTRLLFADFNGMPARERNALRWGLLSERARQLHGDGWGSSAAGLVGMLRLNAGRYPNDPRIGELVDELSAKSAQFGRLWRSGHVATSVVPESKVLHHPLVGPVRLRVEAVAAPHERDQVLQVLIPADPATQSALRRLRTFAHAG